MSSEVKDGAGPDKVEEWATLEEGKAKILHRPGEAFYNPAQVQNRDLSVAVLREFGKLLKREQEERVASGKSKANDTHASAHPGLKVLEGLSATGLRAVRYAKEIDCVDKIIANDFSKAAVESIERNIAHNEVGDKVEASHNDAAMIMYNHRDVSNRFTVVDLDPYGSATPFLDAAVQSVADGGLMAVTCTDLAVLCGAHSEACYAKYGSMSLRGKHCHEQALRIVLSCIETHANRYKRYIVPLLSVHMDFYVRMFVRVYTSASQVKHSAAKQSMVYQCVGCGAYELQPLGKVIVKGNSTKFVPGTGPPVGEFCEHCGFRHQVGGALWNQPTQDNTFVDAVLGQLKDNAGDFAMSKRLFGLVSSCREELQDAPLFHDLSVMAHAMGVECPSNNVFDSAVVNAGYRISHSHTCPTAVKTDAPTSVLWDIMRGWAKLHPAKTVKANSPAEKLTSAESKITPDFTVRPEILKAKKESETPKYVPAPTPDWGPMQKAKGAGMGMAGGAESAKDKRAENQNKNKNKKRAREEEARAGGEAKEGMTGDKQDA